MSLILCCLSNPTPHALKAEVRARARLNLDGFLVAMLASVGGFKGKCLSSKWRIRLLENFDTLIHVPDNSLAVHRVAVQVGQKMILGFAGSEMEKLEGNMMREYGKYLLWWVLSRGRCLFVSFVIRFRCSQQLHSIIPGRAVGGKPGTKQEHMKGDASLKRKK